MWLIGTYKDIHNNTITVKIRNEKNGDNIEIGGALVKFAAEDAVTIDCDRDDYFTHIIKKSATIRLVTRIYLGDYLWAANQKSVIVNILRNGKCVFAGYVTPNTYTQDYVEEWTTLDVNCRDLLSTLEDTNLVDKDKYDAFKQNAQTISLKAYLELFGILNANLNLDNYPQPIFKSNFIWITDGYIYKDNVFYAKLIEVEQVTIDGQVKNIATGNYKLGKVLEPNWILDETKTTTYNGLKYNLEFAYLDIDGDGTYETRTNVSRRTAEPIFDQVYRDTISYGDVIEQIHLEEYTVITNVTRTYVVDYDIHKAGDVEYLRGMEHCPFELRDEPNVSVLRRYVWVYYGNEWHKTNFYEDTDIPVTPEQPKPEPEQPAPKPDTDYLCFTSTGDSTVSMTQYGTPTDISKNKVIQYKINNGQWQTWDLSAVSLADGDKMYIKSDDTIPMSESNDIYKQFVMTGSIVASGSIMSLLNFSTTLTDYAFYCLFKACTSLTTAPELPATTLAGNCYRSMFQACTSLTQAPALPATTLQLSCYQSMFRECTSLTTAPELPATTSATNCYFWMFYSCTSLTQAPELPATLLFTSCYQGMFYNCTSLTHAPELPATELSYSCYRSMFEKCTSLTQAPALPATTLAVQCYYGMFMNCSLLTHAPVLPATTLDKECYAAMFQGCTALTQAPALPATTLYDNCYQWMFFSCASLTTAPELPATTLANNCYQWMFYNCTSLTQAPALPATTLANSCYYGMFYGCASLTTAQTTLPATTLVNSCYYAMFYNCTSLTTTPELPATTLANSCYYAMFYNCTALTTAPELPATTLVDNCYVWMFGTCTKLNYVKAMFTTDPTTGTYLTNWLSNVVETGTFVKNANATWTNEQAGIPTGWTVQSE